MGLSQDASSECATARQHNVAEVASLLPTPERTLTGCADLPFEDFKEGPCNPISVLEYTKKKKKRG